MSAQCDALIVCGREDAGFTCIPDRPSPDLGPLGGLNAALYYAAQNGFDTVLSAPCDVPNLPVNLTLQLGQSRANNASFVQDQPVVGLWPATLADPLTQYIAEGGRALYAFVNVAGARGITLNAPLTNINRPEDLA